jgi:hypothetical protein
MLSANSGMSRFGNVPPTPVTYRSSSTGGAPLALSYSFEKTLQGKIEKMVHEQEAMDWASIFMI